MPLIFLFQNIDKPQWQPKHHPCDPSRQKQGENIYTAYLSSKPGHLGVNNELTKPYMRFAIELWYVFNPGYLIRKTLNPRMTSLVPGRGY